MKALASALAVLRCFDPDRSEWGLTELGVRTGLEKSHVHKILRELVIYPLSSALDCALVHS